MPQPPSRRDLLLYVATGTTGALAIGSAFRGLFSASGPANPPPPSLSLDLLGLAEGAALTFIFEGRPHVLRHRTAAEIAAAEAVDTADLVDPLARNANLAENAPATDANRRATPDGRFIVMGTTCTHLPCVVMDGAGDYGGYFCACHGGDFDTAGRVRKGPPPRNLPIPLFRMEGPDVIVLIGSRTIAPIARERENALLYGVPKG